MSSYESYIFTGYLGKDADLRYTPNGKAVLSFSVAVSSNYANGNGEKVEKTKWLRCSLWGERAEKVAQYLLKGTHVLVEGELQGDDQGNPRTWGEPAKASFDVKVKNFTFLGGGAKNGNGNGKKPEVAEDPIE